MDPILHKFQITCGDSATHIRKLPDRMKKQLAKQVMEILPGRASDVSFSADRAITITDNSFDTRDVFVGTREVTIRHGGERYRLRLTAQNKLILTK